MDLFSGLKSIGDEITRTLDSSQSQTQENKEERESEQQEALSKEGYKSPDTSRDDNKTIQDDWGNWEEVKTSQTTPTTSSRRGPLRPSKSPQTMEQDTSVYLTPNESTNNKSSGKQVNNTSSIPVPVTTSTPTKTTGKIDSLSREELIERVKKQTLLLQKMKSRSEELNKECTKLKTELQQKPSQNEHLVQELQVLKTERDQSLTEIKAVKQIASTLEKEKQSQISALEDKLSVLVEEKPSLMTQQDLDKTRYTQQVEKLQIQVSSQEGELDEKERLARESEREKEKLMEDYHHLEKENVEFTNQKNSLTLRISVLEEKHKNELVTWIEEREKTNTQLFDLQEKLKLAQGVVCEVEELRSRVSGLEREKTEKELRVDVLMNEKKDVVDECVKLKIQLKEMEECVKELKEKEVTSQSGSDMELLQNQLITARGNETKAYEKRREMEEEKVKLEEIVTSLTKKEREMEEEKVQLEERVTSLTKKEREMEEEKVQLEERVTSLTKKEREMEEEKVQLEERVTSLTKKEREMEEEKVQLEERVTSLTKKEREMEEEKVQLEERVTSLTKKEIEMEEEKVQLEERVTSLTKKEREMEEEKVQLEERVTSLTKKEREMEEEKVQLEERVTSLTKKDREEDSKVEERERTLSDEINVVQRELENAQLEIVKMTERCEGLHREKQDTDNENERLDKEIVALKRQLQELSTLRESDTRKESLQEDVIRLEEENTKLRQDLEQRAASHKDEVKKYKSIAVKLKKELTEKETSFKERLTQSQTDKSTSQLTQALSDLESLREEKEKFREELEATLNDSNSKLESVQKMLADEQQKCGTYENDMKILNSQVLDLTDKHKDVASQLTQVTTEKENLVQTFHKLEESYTLLQNELGLKKAELLTSQSEISTAKRSVNDSSAEILSLKEALSKERELHNETQQKLTAVEKEAKASSLMDLELADYQRSIESLKLQLQERENSRRDMDKKISLQQKQIDQLKKDLESSKADSSQKEDMITKLKSLLRKTTKDLNDIKTQMIELQEGNEQLKKDLEINKQDGEMSKVEIAELMAQLKTKTDEYELLHSQQQHLIHSLESKVISLQTELSHVNNEIKEVKDEHETYKVRVHSVLKQKSTNPSISDIENSLRQKHETELLKTRAELKETKERLTSLLVDHEELGVDHDQLVSRHEQLINETTLDKQQLNDRLLESEGKYRMKTREQEELISQLKLEIREVTSAFKSQIHSLQETHHEEVEGFRQELQITHAELSRLQQDADTQVLARRSIQPHLSREESFSLKTVEKVQEMKHVLPSEERSAGEGMDHSELESSGLTTPTQQSLEDQVMSFERLLSSGSNDFLSINGRGQAVWPTDEEDVGILQKQIQLSTKKMSHLTELLHESEENCVRLADQARLLKEEIRRLERNQERYLESSNMEYLKNVVLKFLHTDDEERTSLIPVITKLLQLSQQERQYLSETTREVASTVPSYLSQVSEEQSFTTAVLELTNLSEKRKTGRNKVELPDSSGGAAIGSGKTKGWTSYLHRWTGY